ncbi:MAG: SIS domain-containing protein [Ignavibacteria bacterium]|nr:SIS domain-containing protein [Ignavibacteria bacterium]
MEYINRYFNEVLKVVDKLKRESILQIVKKLSELRKAGGRLFILGVGGSAANASHAVNDFRKICGIESYAPSDNVSELTARTNDDGWESVFINWLKTAKLTSRDAIFVLSVGGGNAEKNISVNLIKAIDYAKERKAAILGIVGKDGGYTARNADCCVIIPVISDDTITPHSEAFQSVVLHLIVSHPDLKENQMKWESTK